MSILNRVSASDLKEWEKREKEIATHPAWHADLSGIECEELLRGLPTGSYLFREGEKRFQYYLSFVIDNAFTFKHQPFLIVTNDDQTRWGYRNGAHHWASTLQDLIPLVLHCRSEECYPVLRRSNGR